MIVLESCSVSKTFDGKNWALKDVTFHVNSGEVLALLGPNGAGKTTFIRIASTELLPTYGTVKILGYDVVKEPSKVRKHITVIPQEVKPIGFLTPWEIVFSYLLIKGYSFRDAKRLTEWVLKELDLWNHKDKQCYFLSGGLKHRIFVALALASNSEVIFLDEPTTG